MRIAGTIPYSVVNGTGVRFVVFVQGCAHHCRGCHNPDTWDFNGGDYISPEVLAALIRSKPYIDGVTLSGGDPFYQEAACLELMEHLPADTDLWVYTGFEYDEIKETALAKRANVLVTGPYIEELRCVGQMYGSTNQEIHRKEDTGCS